VVRGWTGRMVGLYAWSDGKGCSLSGEGGGTTRVPYTAGGKGKGCTTDMTHSGWIGVERMWKGVQAVTGGGHRRGSMHTRPPLAKYLPTAAFLRCFWDKLGCIGLCGDNRATTVRRKAMHHMCTTVPPSTHSHQKHLLLSADGVLLRIVIN